MKFKEAYKLMKKGKYIKLPDWTNYWFMNLINEICEANEHEENGIDDVNSIQDILKYTMSEDWEEATVFNTEVLRNRKNLDFITALSISVETGIPITLYTDDGERVLRPFTLVDDADAITMHVITSDGFNSTTKVSYDQINTKTWGIVK